MSGEQPPRQPSEGQEELLAHEILGVPEGTTDRRTILAARRRFADEHPDVGGDEELLKRVNAAADFLLGKNVNVDDLERENRIRARRAATQQHREGARTESNQARSSNASGTNSTDDFLRDAARRRAYEQAAGDRARAAAEELLRKMRERAQRAGRGSNGGSPPPPPREDSQSEDEPEEEPETDQRPNFSPPAPPFRGPENPHAKEWAFAERFFDSIHWVASFERPDEYLVGVKDGLQYLLDRHTHKRLSIGYEEFAKRDKNTLVGIRDGQEFVVDQKTGKEKSTGFDRVDRDRVNRVVGSRHEDRSRTILGEKKKEDEKNKKGGH